MRVVVFEDEFVENLDPLTLIRPTFALRCGATLLYGKVLRAFPKSKLYLFMREQLIEAFLARAPCRERLEALKSLKVLEGDDCLLLNGRWIFDGGLIEEDELIALKDEAVIYAHLKKSTLAKALERAENLGELLEWAKSELSLKKMNEARMINYPWDLIYQNPDEIKKEFKKFKESGREADPRSFQGVYIVGEREDIFIARSAKLAPMTLLDASNGPIIIDEDVEIHSFSSIQGPCYIGRGSWIVGGKIRGGTTIGPVCRVGGEVDASIIHGYSNKYHEGFLGHSYVGEWVNLGALTSTSDLKNDYSEVEVYIRGKLIKTGRRKVGSFIGDHTKTGIGVFLTTGSNIGVMCNLISSGAPPPKYVPSFTWYIRGKMSKGFGLKAMLRTAKVMMSRRGVELTEAEEKLYQRLYEETRGERERLIKLHKARGG